MNKVNALKLMGNYRNVIDIQKGGEHGRTALHLAAIYDHEECARILVRWVKFTIFHALNHQPPDHRYVKPIKLIYNISCVLRIFYVQK